MKVRSIRPQKDRQPNRTATGPTWTAVAVLAGSKAVRLSVHLICRLVVEPQKTGLNRSTTGPSVYPKCFKKRQSTSDRLCILYGLSREKPASQVAMTGGFLSRDDIPRESCQHEARGAHICNNVLKRYKIIIDLSNPHLMVT